MSASLAGALAAAGPHLEGTSLRPAGTAQAQYAFDVASGVAGCSRVALIFNVGSGFDPAYGILDTLGAYGVPASMFIMGWLAEQNPALVQAIAGAGHVIGSHGYLPPELTIRSDDDVIYDLNAAAGALGWALGYPPSPWFTPYASASDDRVRSLASSLGLITVGWSVSTGDWEPWATADMIYGNAVGGAFDGAIIELHFDSEQSVAGTAVALPWILDELGAQGYSFATVPGITGGC